MGYVAPTWQNGGPPALNAKNMQDISDNLAYVSNNMVNPNLLDNWYFGNPVNQRGQTSYSTTGDGSYTIDRWRFGGYAQTIEVTGNGITWNTNTGVWWMQTIENWDALVGKTATISALIGGNLYSVSGVVNNSDRISVAVSETVNLEISPTERGVRLVSYVTESTSVSALLAIKLELGSQQTLAHQENGVWVLNEIPKFGDQLAECLRCLVDITPTQKFNVSYIGELSSNGAIICIPLPASMRTTPTFVGNASDIQIAAESVPGYYTPTSVSVIGSSSVSVAIRCDFVHDKSPGTLCDFRKTSDDAKFFLSAEL